MKRIFAIGVMILLSACLAAQQLTVQAPSSVSEGDNFTVRFVVDDIASDFTPPTFGGLRIQSGPSRSSQSSMSIVNGNVSKSQQTSFSYTLYAEKEGEYNIGVAECKVGDKRISSHPFTIKVEKLTPAQQQQRQQQRQSFDPWNQQPQQATKIDETTLFAKTSISKTNAYQGEQIIVTYKIYTQVPISRYSIDKLPGNKGFWAEDLTAGQQVKTYEETVDGRRYQVAEIKKGALFAQQSGRLSIERLDMNVLAMVQKQRRRTGTWLDLFDDPFFSSAQAVEYPLHTSQIGINIKPLPSAPESFYGGVGSFDVSAGLSQTEVKANEAVSYKVTISGSGNLMLINAPNVDFPSSFEVYDPVVTDNLKRTDSGVSGSRTYEWVIIPRSQGEYTIPKTEFSYFDPQRGQYISKELSAKQLKVMRGDAQMSQTFVGKDDVKMLANDINYIHPVRHLYVKNKSARIEWWFVVIAILIIGLTYFAIKQTKKHDVALADTVGMKRKQAIKKARKRLKRAEEYLKTGNQERFYEAIYRAIWECLSDKYSIPFSQLNHDSVALCLQDRGVEEAQKERILDVLKIVDMARFAPGDAATSMQHVYEEALNMIASL